MAAFMSISQLEQGASPAQATVHAVRLPGPDGTRWLVYKPGTHPRVPVALPDHIFRDLFAPRDEPARMMFRA